MIKIASAGRISRGLRNKPPYAAVCVLYLDPRSMLFRVRYRESGGGGTQTVPIQCTVNWLKTWTRPQAKLQPDSYLVRKQPNRGWQDVLLQIRGHSK